MNNDLYYLKKVAVWKNLHLYISEIRKKRMPEKIRMKKRKKIIIAVIASIAVVLLIAGFLSFRKTRAEMARAQALRSISSAQLSRRSIRTTVVGNGTLTGGDAEELKVPKGVIVKKVYVKSGDSVRKGDLLASLDPESVRKLIAEVHEKIASVDDKLLQIEEYDEDEEIKAPVTGTVTRVFVRDGSYIPDIMERNGALMTLTADSSMKKFPVGALTGEVLEIYVTEGDRVYQGDPLLLIRTVKDEARRRQLLNDREGLSEALDEYYALLKSCQITAEHDGVIRDVFVEDDSVVTGSPVSSSSGSTDLTSLLGNQDTSQLSSFGAWTGMSMTHSDNLPEEGGFTNDLTASAGTFSAGSETEPGFVFLSYEYPEAEFHEDRSGDSVHFAAEAPEAVYEESGADYNDLSSEEYVFSPDHAETNSYGNTADITSGRPASGADTGSPEGDAGHHVHDDVLGEASSLSEEYLSDDSTYGEAAYASPDIFLQDSEEAVFTSESSDSVIDPFSQGNSPLPDNTHPGALPGGLQLPEGTDLNTLLANLRLPEGTDLNTLLNNLQLPDNVNLYTLLGGLQLPEGMDLSTLLGTVQLPEGTNLSTLLSGLQLPEGTDLSRLLSTLLLWNSSVSPEGLDEYLETGTAPDQFLLPGGFSLQDVMNGIVLPEGSDWNSLLSRFLSSVNGNGTYGNLLSLVNNLGPLLSSGGNLASLLGSGANLSSLLSSGTGLASLLGSGADLASFFGSAGNLSSLFGSGMDLGSLLGSGADLAGMLGSAVLLSSLFGGNADPDALFGSGSASLSGLLGASGLSSGLSDSISAASAYALVPAFSISEEETMEITIAVNEMDILSVNKGQSAEITLDALPGKSFEGLVTNISSTGTNTGGATKYDVTVEVPKDPDMRSDMSCTVSILVSEADDVNVIPSAALITEQSKNYVYTELSPEGTLIGRTEITTGISDGEYVEVKDGLSEDQTVYYRQKSVNLLEKSMEAMGGYTQSQVAG